MAEQAPAEADQDGAEREQRHRLQRGGEDHGAEGRKANQGADRGQAVGIGATAESFRADAKAGKPARRQQRTQRRGGADGQMQHLAAIGFEQDVLHRERYAAEAERHQFSNGLACRCEKSRQASANVGLGRS